MAVQPYNTQWLMMNSFELSTAHHTSWRAPIASPWRAATIRFATGWIKTLGVASLKTCVLVAKEGYEHSQYPNPDYVGFRIPNRIVVGYGLDYNEKYRNLRLIGILKPEIYER